MLIDLAGVRIAINARYDQVRRMARDYLIEGTEESADITISVSEAEIDSFAELTSEKLPRGAHEATAILSTLCDELLDFDAFFLHAAVVAVNNEAFAFSARSGTGKSTHVRQWMKRFGDEVAVINGDKPFCFRRGKELLASGTPWCGKEGWQTNKQVSLKGICFLERGGKNKIRPLHQSEIVDYLFPQLRLPSEPQKLVKLMELIDWTVRYIPFYVLECTIDEKAAEVAYEGMTQLKHNEQFK